MPLPSISYQGLTGHSLDRRSRPALRCIPHSTSTHRQDKRSASASQHPYSPYPTSTNHKPGVLPRKFPTSPLEDLVFAATWPHRHPRVDAKVNVNANAHANLRYPITTPSLHFPPPLPLRFRFRPRFRSHFRYFHSPSGGAAGLHLEIGGLRQPAREKNPMSTGKEGNRDWKV
jgi:hypothetical protein